ncbi:GNAT family N-acetyltransferase [Plantibacter sp. LMC-P-059a]|uniref:GNAT family N-acetyltransferase n=1 Tax=Plantibacter sp. LMC-P-059a TaxID=3040297 RepID=UPI00255035E6|nr:GNAT family N-acetyltransferase [Plantibacter sp. LMC-P-059a]
MNLRTVELDHTDHAALDLWWGAASRGFLSKPETDVAVRAERRQLLVGSSILGVYDDTAAEPLVPVATLGSFPTAFSIPGGTVRALAITEVTVSTSHERRGIARSLMENRLHHAQATGAAIVALTASEATIYGRYGFAPATWEYTHEVDPKRVAWRGAPPAGRVHTLDPRSLAIVAPELFERSRGAGDIDRGVAWWKQALREVTIRHFSHGEGDTLALRYDDADGEPQGYALYRVGEEWGTIVVDDLIATTPEARYALWRHLTGISLTTKVTFQQAPADEAIPWRLVDRRAVKTTARADSLWLRIVDVPTVLGARRFTVPGPSAPREHVLDVVDALGFAEGRFMLRIDERGAAVAERLGDVPESDTDTDAVRLTINELSAILLGGPRVSALAEAGLITGSADAVRALDLAFATERAPFLRTHF